MLQAKKQQNVSGFTLVELIVIIAIVGFMSATVISGQRVGSEQRKLTLESQKVVQSIRKAQNLAMSAQKSDCPGNTTVPFGIILSSGVPGQYYLVADCDKSLTYNGGDVIMETKILGDSRINSVNPVNVNGNVEIFFSPPIPQTSINTSTSDLTSATVVLVGRRRTEFSKTINVNTKGMISIQ